MNIRQWWNDLRGGVRVTDGRYGRIAYYKHDEWHGKSLREYGEWSENEVRLWRNLIRTGDCVVDVGAHIGAHTLALRDLVGPLGHVDAYEMQPKIAELLRRNTRPYRNVFVHEIALGDGANTVMMYNEPDYRKPGNFGGVELFTFSATYGQAVICRKLDELGTYGVRFIKIDVEGMELEVLRGAERTVKRDKPVIYAECDRREKLSALLDWLWSRRYSVRWHLPPIFNPGNVRNNQRNVFGDTVSVNLLALPQTAAVWPHDPHLYPICAIELTDDGVVINA